MATNFIKHGDEIPYANGTGTGIKSGDVVVIGDLVGVALGDILDGSTGTVQLCGVATLPKTTGQAWTQGAKLYWNGTDKFTTTVGTNVWAGWAYSAAASGDTTGQVKLKIS
jgi:predicted RecA/RadA family phage recombinase